ncbi:MAG: hypothetical protein IT365_23215 [Candidatus Hydrogenedentes bacterium]|nr:hypothetical protein [Candidatus Hydrogenedentota bacterium]
MSSHTPRTLSPLAAVVIAAGILLASIAGVVLVDRGGQAVSLAATGETPADAPTSLPPPKVPGGTPAIAQAPVAELAAASSDMLNVIGMVPLPGRKLESQIILFFDHDIVLPNAPDGAVAPPFELSPKLDGEFQSGANYAAFTIADEQTLLPNQLYDVRLTPGIVSKDGKELNPQHRLLRVATYIFEPQRVWLLERDDHDDMVLGILFPTDVDLGALREHLAVTDAVEKAVPFTLERGSSEGLFRLAVSVDAEIPLKVLIRDGLKDSAAQFTLAGDRTFAYPVEPFFHVTGVKWGARTGDWCDILVSFSKPLNADDLKWHVSLTHLPDQERLAFDVPESKVDSSHIIRVQRGSPMGAVRFGLSKKLHGENGSRLVDDYACTLPPTPKSLTVKGTQWGPSENTAYVLFIGFSSPVDFQDLEKHLSILDERSNAPIAYTIDTRSVEKDHRIRIVHPAPEGPRVLVKVSDGLIAPDKSVLLDSFSSSLTWTHRKLYITGEPITKGRDGIVVNISFNTAINVSDLQKHLVVSPSAGDLRIVAESKTQFTVYGKWKKGVQYQLTVTPGVRFSDGTACTVEANWDLKIGHVAPVLEFSHPGKCYFTMREGSPLGVVYMGIQNAHITVHRVFPSNLVYALGGITRDSRPVDYYEGRRDIVNALITKWSEPIHEGELSLTASPDEVAQANLNVGEWFPPDKRGVFCVVAEHGSGLQASKLVALTNVGAISHWQDDNLMLFAHNLLTLAPLAHARVSIYSTKKQLLHMGSTDERGILKAGGFDPDLGLPELAVIEYENDATFLELIPREDETPEIKAGMPHYDSEEYDGYLYADRDLYRPGETVHLRCLARTNYGDALADVPLEFRIRDPRDSVVSTQPIKLSAFGSGSLDFVTKDTHPTGLYTAEIRIPGHGSGAIGSYAFKLEEFVPNRMKVTVNLPANVLLAGRESEFSLKAEHLFGANAGDRKTSCEVVLEKGAWRPESRADFTFTNDVSFTPERLNCGEQQTDGAGMATFRFSYVPPASASFPLKATVVGSVSELGGRVVTSIAEGTFFPSDICLGLRANERQGGGGVEVQVAAVKPDGTPADLASVKVTLEREVWNYYVRRYYSNYESRWTDTYEEIETRDVPLQQGMGSLAMETRGYGRFRLRVSSEKTPQFSTLTFHSYWHGGRLSFGPSDGMSLLKVRLDKKAYRPGEEATVLVESPFDGRGILVVQGEKIQEMIPFEILSNKAEIKVAVTEEKVPNLWIEVTALHEVQTDRAQVYPFSSFAMIPLMVADGKRILNIAFTDLPSEIRPATEARFDLLVKDGNGVPVSSELTLAAVDEGIHAITDYSNPDPYSHFARPRQPDYRRAHYYDKVAYDFDKAGFGGDGRLVKRAITIGENWIKPLALWSGAVTTDAEGKASVSMQLPEFSGQLRLVAVACTGVASGAGSGNVYVRRPYVLRTSMPRFLLPGDAVECAAAVFNTTEQPMRALLTWKVTGPLTTETGEQHVELPAKGEARVTARFAAMQAVGQGHIEWHAVISDLANNTIEDLKEDAPMPVRPSSGYQSRHDFFVLDAGKTETFGNSLFIENEYMETGISVTANPMARLERPLSYVVGYPHGCVEQTVSKLMSMYLLRSSREMTGRAIGDGNDLDKWIDAGVQRIFSMQTSNGGLAYWPGGHDAYTYGSIYALHFLTLLKNDRQFSIPEAPYEGLRRYVRSAAADWSDQSSSNQYARAYALYVLTLSGDTDAVKQIRRFDTIEMPQPARYLLAAALAKATQDFDRVKMYLSEMPSVPYAVVERTACLSSDIRNTAVELMALRQMGGDPAEIHKRAETLIRFLQQRGHGNTQETAFVVTALCEYLAELAANLDNASASVVGPAGAKAVGGRERFFENGRGAGRSYAVTNTGQAPMFVNLTTAGFLKEPQTAAVREGIGLERVVLTRDGKPQEGGEFRQSDTYIVHLTIHCDRSTDNVVVVDMLPAGFEIENPRLTKNLPQLDSGQSVTPSYTDLRDDRIILAFDHMATGTYHYHYVVRAVTPGVYQYPAVEAECMYDAEIRGASEASTITVKRAE